MYQLNQKTIHNLRKRAEIKAEAVFKKDEEVRSIRVFEDGQVTVYDPDVKEYDNELSFENGVKMSAIIGIMALAGYWCKSLK